MWESVLVFASIGLVGLAMRMRHATAPPFPSIATAALGRTSPAVTSASGMRSGYVGQMGFVSSDRAARPMVVAQSHGIA